MKIAVFGATGQTGKHLVEQALAAGHEVVAFARTPSKLQANHERLSIVTGDAQDLASVERAVAGVDAAVSALGPTANAPDYQVARGMGNILVAMKNKGVRRLVVAAGAGVEDPQDRPTLVNKAIKLLLLAAARHRMKI